MKDGGCRELVRDFAVVRPPAASGPDSGAGALLMNVFPLRFDSDPTTCFRPERRSHRSGSVRDSAVRL